jgi:hypothetical protein
MQTYPTNLTENQWKVIENILNDNRKRKHDLKEIFNAIFYFTIIRLKPDLFPFQLQLSHNQA